jgi:HlyD family secretion protein
MKKIIIVLVIIAIGVAGWFGFQEYQRRKTSQELSNLQTIEAARANLVASVGATGVVRPNQTALLSWQTSGSVKEANVQIGDSVSTGEILAELEQTSLPQNIILAQADLVNAQKSLDDLYSNANTARTEALKSISTFTKSVRDAQYKLDNFTVPSNQAQLDTVEAVNFMEQTLNDAREAFEPYKHLSSGNATRQDLKDELERAQSDYDTAVKRLEYEYELEVAKDNLQKAKDDYESWENGPDPNDVAAAKARIAAAEATLKHAWIEAPFSGTITISEPQPGDQVMANMEAFRLDDLSRLLLEVEVSEVDINRIQVGQDVSLSFDAVLDREYAGKVLQVDPVGTSNQGVVDFTVTVELTDTDKNVKPGMTAAVNIVVEKLEDVLMVPNRAVRLKDGKRVVYILVDNLPTPVEIKLGSSSDMMSEVLDSELKPGDLIVLNPPIEFERGGPPPFVNR